jgi:hypothetical protein
MRKVKIEFVLETDGCWLSRSQNGWTSTLQHPLRVSAEFHGEAVVGD